MTPILKVLTEYCAVYVDDIRLEELASVDAPLWARRMYGYFRAAVPLFNLPSEMPEFLLGREGDEKLVEPRFADALYQVPVNEASDFTVDLGEDYAGFDLCACRMRSVDGVGNVMLIPFPSDYDAERGDVVVHATATREIPEGAYLEFDLYRDGYFRNTLSAEIMSILGMCFQVVWQDRFNTDWLSNVSKIEDKSFFEQNRANKENADTARLRMLREKLAGEMRRYEQNLYQRQFISASKRIKL